MTIESTIDVGTTVRAELRKLIATLLPALT
jgi:hypothetical protein